MLIKSVKKNSSEGGKKKVQPHQTLDIQGKKDGGTKGKGEKARRNSDAY